jgi:hypothetical protein
VLEQHAKATKLKSKKTNNLGVGHSSKKNGSSGVARINEKLHKQDLRNSRVAHIS